MDPRSAALTKRGGRVLRFGEFELDEETRRLRRRGVLVPLQGRVTSVLGHLVANAGRSIGRRELMEVVWQGVVVGPDALNRVIYLLRRTLGSDRATPEFIRTVRGVGYRFVAAVEVADIRGDAEGGGADGGRAGDVPFVGRTSVLARLESAVASTFRGPGRLVMLIGEPGSGKTRLTWEIESIGRDSGMLVGRASPSPDSMRSPFSMWARLIRSLSSRVQATGVHREGVSLGAEIRAELAQRGSSTGTRDGVDEGVGGIDIRDLSDRLGRYLSDLALTAPVLLVFDSIDEADLQSVLLLEELVHSLLDSRFLVLITFSERVFDSAASLRRTLGFLSRHPQTETVHLHCMAECEIRRLVGAVVGRDLATEALERIVAQSEGVPGYAVAMARWMRDAGQGGVAAENPPGRRVPVGRILRFAVDRDLGRLSPSTLLALEVAAISDGEFPVTAVADAGLDDGRDLSWLAEAERAGVLEAVDDAGTRYRFSRQAVREVFRLSARPGSRSGSRSKRPLEVERGRSGLPPGARGLMPGSPADGRAPSDRPLRSGAR